MEREKRPENIEVGKRLHDARENLGYTQANFAELLSVTDEHYRKIEAGNTGLTIDKMKTLYYKMNIDPTFLIVGENRMDFDLDTYLANCTRAQRDAFIKRVLAYMAKVMIK